MRIWRICKARFEATAFSGRGAAAYPGRWNSAGRRAVYCAETRSLASLEILAHVKSKRRLHKAKFIAIPVDLDDSLVQKPARLPAAWEAMPATDISRLFADRKLQNVRFPVLRVPSVIVRGEWCYVLNPEHPRFVELVIGVAEPFSFDVRVVT